MDLICPSLADLQVGLGSSAPARRQLHAEGPNWGIGNPGLSDSRGLPVGLVEPTQRLVSLVEPGESVTLKNLAITPGSS